MNRQPTDSNNSADFPQESQINGCSINVIPQQYQTQCVDNGCQNLRSYDIAVQAMNSAAHVQNLRKDQSTKGYCDYSHERLLEQQDAQHHDDYSLVDTDPEPSEECARVQLSALL